MDSPFHENARSWWDSVLSNSEPVCLPWVTILGFIRISTGRHVLTKPMTHTAACGHVESWFGQPCVRTLDPLPGHWTRVQTLLRDAGTAGNLATDAHLAALAMEHGCELFSTDADFARFAGLRWTNPVH
jgi:uncharacterized protein